MSRHRHSRANDNINRTNCPGCGPYAGVFGRHRADCHHAPIQQTPTDDQGEFLIAHGPQSALCNALHNDGHSVHNRRSGEPNGSRGANMQVRGVGARESLQENDPQRLAQLRVCRDIKTKRCFFGPKPSKRYLTRRNVVRHSKSKPGSPR